MPRRAQKGPKPAAQAAQPIAVGEWVEAGTIRRAGRVAEIDAARKTAIVVINNQRWTVALTKLARAEAPKGEAAGAAGGVRGPNMPATYEIDLHGMRVEEAVHAAEKFLDSAIVARLTSVKVIHGHGTGKVRDAVRRMLARSPHVADFRFGGPAEGGLAATLVFIRE